MKKLIAIVLVIALAAGFVVLSKGTSKPITTDIYSTEGILPGGVNVAVGDSTDKMLKAIGSNCSQNGSNYEYALGEVTLLFVITGGKVSEIDYTLTPDKETREVISEMAKLCGKSIEDIHEFCQQIKYNNSYGGENPILYGFINWSGNCFVHAMCYQALLQYKGYDVQIIHCVDFSHYWNLVQASREDRRGWWHADSTPGPLHGPTPTLATDAERFETLQNGYEGLYIRNWDRDKWPSAPEL